MIIVPSLILVGLVIVPALVLVGLIGLIIIPALVGLIAVPALILFKPVIAFEICLIFDRITWIIVIDKGLFAF